MRQRPLHDELLSAYLDGELSAAEREHVDNWLAGDPQAVKTLKELTAVRATLGVLPTYRLPASFAECVLAEAEKRGKSASNGNGSPDSTPNANAEPAMLNHVDWQRWRRPLVWAAAAIAIALIVNHFNPEPEPGQQHAQAPDDGRASNTTIEDRKPSIGAPKAIGSVEQGPKTGGLLVVKSDVSESAVRAKVFRQLLTAHQIAWSGRPPHDAQAAHSEVGKPSQASAQAPEAQSSLPQLELVYVEASPAQLAAMLAELSQKEEAFLTLAVHPVPGVSQHSEWKQIFSRQRVVQPAPAGKIAASPLAPPSMASAARQSAQPLPAPHAELIEIPRDAASYNSDASPPAGKLIRMEERPASSPPAVSALRPELQRALFIFQLAEPS